jgi:hypothetical protein
MTKHCLNCGHPVKEKYCPNCSQATDVERISWKSFGEEFIHTLAHAEKSVAGTTWLLVKNPGKVLDEYIAGKRKKYQGPVGFFAIWVTTAILVHRSIIAYRGFHPVYLEGLTFSSAESIKAFITHGELFYLISFPLSAALFYFILARPLYSYIESLVITIYAFSVAYMMHTCCYLLGGVMMGLNVLHWRFYLFQIVLSLAYSLWVCITLFRRKGIKLLWLRIIFYLTVNVVAVLKFLELLSGLWVRIEDYFYF